MALDFVVRLKLTVAPSEGGCHGVKPYLMAE